MPDTFTNTAATANTGLECERKKLETWVSHDLTGDKTWWQIPKVSAQRKTANRDTGQTIVVDGVAVNLCSAASTSWQYQVDVFHNDDEPLENFVLDEQTVSVLMINGEQATADPWEEFTAKYVDNGWTRDTQGNGLQIRTMQFDVDSTIERSNYTEVVGSPNNASVNV